MRRYTRRGDLVIDPFAGSGTTLIEARRLGRPAIGVELNPAVAEQTRATLASEPDRRHALCALEVGDSTTFDWRATLEHYGFRSAQLAILHPPYHDIIRFSEDRRDLANAPSVDTFLTRLGEAVARVADVLDPGRYLALVLGDKICQWRVDSARISGDAGSAAPRIHAQKHRGEEFRADDRQAQPERTLALSRAGWRVLCVQA